MMNRKILSLLFAAIMLCSCVLSLSSCGKVIEDGAEISVYLCDEIYDLDPAASYTDDNSLMLISMLFEPLFGLDDEGKIVFAAAEDYEIDKDTGDLVIELRESYWNDGRRVLAGDFVYAWRRIMRPDFSSPAATLLYDVKNAVNVKSGNLKLDSNGNPTNDSYSVYDLGVKAEDEKTIRISFEHEDVDYKAFIHNLASVMLSPVSASNVESGPDYWTKTAGTLYCNGPFELQQLNYLYGYLTLARNNGYHRPSGSSKAIDAYVKPGYIRTLWKTDADLSKGDYLDKMYDYVEKNVIFYIGSLDYINDSGNGVTDNAHRGAAENLKTVNRLSTYTYVFNHENELFSNPEVRRILAAVIDRNEIINNCVIHGQAATGLVPPAVMNDSRRNSFREEGGDFALLSQPMSIEDAAARLAELNVTPGEFTIAYNKDHPDEEAIAYYVSELWGQLGYTINIKGVGYRNLVVDETTYRDSGIQVDYENGDFDVIGIDMQMLGANPFPIFATLTSTMSGNAGGKNNAKWEDDQYNRLVAEALALSDMGERAEKLHEAEAYLMEKMPIVPLYFKQTYYVQNEKMLSGVDFGYHGFPIFTEAELDDYDKYFFDEMDKIFFPKEEEDE
ncbi:MAG: hypothetical protein J6R42_00560 [Clostridia bacterium]|nr:hypothetical protein [Clostridia bacterium]